MTEGSEYQKLRSHLAFLRMTAAAEALPGELDHAIKAKLTHQGFLERLLSLEVDAVAAHRADRVVLDIAARIVRVGERNRRVLLAAEDVVLDREDCVEPSRALS